ncbi:MAG: DUF1499 domain-containing protein [Candidatus Binatia bacterium]
MRIVKWLLVAVAVFATLLAGGVVGNRLPLAAPPGVGVRLSTYLNTHVAETKPDSAFPELRTRNYSLPADVLYSKVKETVGQMPGWEIVESSDDRREVHAVVTTKLFRFKDDVKIAVTPEPGGRPALTVRGESRVGKGDLGANARHVLDLYDALAAAGVKGGVEG